MTYPNAPDLKRRIQMKIDFYIPNENNLMKQVEYLILQVSRRH